MKLKKNIRYIIFISCVVISIIILIYSQTWSTYIMLTPEMIMPSEVKEKMLSLFAIVDNIEENLILNHPILTQITSLSSHYDNDNNNNDNSIHHHQTSHPITLQPLEHLAYELLSYRSYFTQLRWQTQQKSKKHHQRILCTTFLSWKNTSIDMTVKNYQSTSHLCDWILFVYDSKGLSLDDMNYEFHRLLMNSNSNKRSSSNNNNNNNYKIKLAPSRRTEIKSSFKKTCLSYMNRLQYLIDNKENSMNSNSNGMNYNNINNKLNLLSLCQFIESDSSSSTTHDNQDNSNYYDYDLHINHQIYPKLQLLIMLLPVLPNYDYIWLLDNDIDLTDFNFQHFLNIHACAFKPSSPSSPSSSFSSSSSFFNYKGGRTQSIVEERMQQEITERPIVAQPLLQEYKPYYQFLGEVSWHHVIRPAESYPYASTTGFVEIQIPFIQSDYLQWYILSFILPMFQPMNILGADWGFDFLLCQTSKLFAYPNELDYLLLEHLDIITNPPTTNKRSSGPSSSSSLALSIYQWLLPSYSPMINRVLSLLSNVITIPPIWKKYLNPPQPFRLKKMSSCAIIIGGDEDRHLSVLHTDNREIQIRLGNNHAIKAEWNSKLVQLIQKNYPHFYVEGFIKKASLFKSANRYERIYDLDLNQCMNSNHYIQQQQQLIANDITTATSNTWKD